MFIDIGSLSIAAQERNGSGQTSNYAPTELERTAGESNL